MCAALVLCLATLVGAIAQHSFKLQGHLPFHEVVRLSECVLNNSLVSMHGSFEDMNLLPLIRWAAGHGARPGTFVELGAHDGVTLSTT